ncbi:MAG: hypothetical protein M1836_000955 [Candelina mexicana]|nr:MAG: hypothetical protein M1836_000955 [Candelina mexicana]
MLFSALYGMLPSAKRYLINGGFAPQAAVFTLIGCFLAGVIGIQILSRWLHHYIPSHVVDCDHTHEEQNHGHTEEPQHDANGHHKGSHHNDHDHNHVHVREGSAHHSNNHTESTPLLSTSCPSQSPHDPAEYPKPGKSLRRPSFRTRLTTGVTSLVKGQNTCDEVGPCAGYTDLCGQECRKIRQLQPMHQKEPRSLPKRRASQFMLQRTPSTPFPPNRTLAPVAIEEDEEAALGSRNPISEESSSPSSSSKGSSVDALNGDLHRSRTITPSTSNGNISKESVKHGDFCPAPPPNESAQPHHHHVATNAFLSIGLQTSIAIALHKLPEGFITFATNHANPKLGFAVFVALFIHNITEGFAMALPLYLALGSRWKAMFWSSLLGGISQPLGAGIAALWFKVAGKGDNAPTQGLYGGMFAVTAGIMASVALQLFTESLSMTHNRTLCVAFAFIGMGILGFSFALTAG